jgi:hypothetical protein
MAKRAAMQLRDELQEGGREAARGIEAPRAGSGMTKATKRLMQPAGCRAYMRRTLATEFPGIVEGFVEAAKTGSCPHVKLATELLKPTRKGTTRKKSGLAAKMLMEWKKELGSVRKESEET